jgi:DNA-binding response OmpR family regulator
VTGTATGSRRICPVPTDALPATGSSSGTGGARGLVLVVEDESAIAEIIRLNLAKAGYGVQVERDGEAGLAAIRRLHPAAVILDVGLPGIDGIEVCRRLRSERDWTPVLFVTARDDEVDRIVGLELGADDYVTKPFSPRELVARVTSVLRRSQGVPEASPASEVGGVRLEPGERRVFADDTEIELTATEFDLLAYLMRRPGRVFSREQLISEVWGYSAVAGVRTVDVHIAQVRGKLGDASPIRTVRGVGYSVEHRSVEPKSVGSDRG